MRILEKDDSLVLLTSVSRYYVLELALRVKNTIITH